MCVACESKPAPVGTPVTPVVSSRRPAGVRPNQLVVGLTPFVTEPKLRREFQPLADYLGGRVGLPAVLRRAESYADVPRMVIGDEVHLAVLSPLAYVRAKRARPDLVLLATQIADGSSTYSGYLVVRDEPRVERLADLRARRFAYVDRNSASGYLYPLAYMRASGLVPEQFFSSIIFAGNHEKAINQLLAREVDVIAVASPVMRMMGDERVEARRLKILAKTGRIPFDAYCVNPSLSGELIDQLRSALLELNTRSDEGRRVLGGLASINGFVAVNDDHYDEVRRVVQIVEEAEAAAP